MAEWSFYNEDNISAVDARFEAQKIAFAPFIFHAARAMINLGLLAAILEGGAGGASIEEISEKCGISEYGCKVLVEAGLGIGAIKLTEGGRLTLGKIGLFLCDDELTKVNINFVNDVCYAGAAKLEESIKSGRPEGLNVFGNEWRTIYEALSTLPQQAKKSWLAFDHNYSDHIFPEAMEIVFRSKPRVIFDIGGNTARFALACAEYDENARVKIYDLPGQCKMAEENIRARGLQERITTEAIDVLDAAPLAKGADAIWMSQFLDCFSIEGISRIAAKVREACGDETRVFVLEPLIDRQQYRASSFCLQQTSLYFTTMANGSSKMYNFSEIVPAIEKGGLRLKEAYGNLGIFSYTLLEFGRA